MKFLTSEVGDDDSHSDKMDAMLCTEWYKFTSQ